MYMSRASILSIYAIIGLGSVVSIAAGHDQSADLFGSSRGQSKCPTGFANFGDSLSDTGNTDDAFPFGSVSWADNRPYGETFFGSPAKRFSNGRLVPDFFALAFGTPLLDAYFAITAVDYRHGVNFAAAGATATFTKTAATPFSVVPVQINQFIRFKNSINATQRQGAVCKDFLRKLPTGNPFASWLYTIEAGGNDIINELLGGTPLPNITSTLVPAMIGNISTAIEILYGESARNFLVFNIPAAGCDTFILTLLGNFSLPTDSMGCIEPVNQLIQGYNAGLLGAIQALRQKLPGVSISLFDYYAANIEILTHPAAYGFNPNLTKTACCGTPGVGTLNYNPANICGLPGSTNCANPDEYVVWDGIHFTENFYRAIAKFALSGKNFTDQGIDYETQCNLDYSKFGPKVTYEEAFPDDCNNLFT